MKKLGVLTIFCLLSFNVFGGIRYSDVGLEQLKDFFSDSDNSVLQCVDEIMGISECLYKKARAKATQSELSLMLLEKKNQGKDFDSEDSDDLELVVDPSLSAKDIIETFQKGFRGFSEILTASKVSKKNPAYQTLLAKCGENIPTLKEFKKYYDREEEAFCNGSYLI